MAGTRMLVVGLVVAGSACGAAAAALPRFGLTVHAHLAPVDGTKASGNFSGTLLSAFGAMPSDSQWRLTWRLSLPTLHGGMTAALRVDAAGGAAQTTRTLCTQCSTTASGVLELTRSQQLRILKGESVVVVRTPSATLRGPVDVLMAVPQPRA
jgi:hypothetical protein